MSATAVCTVRSLRSYRVKCEVMCHFSTQWSRSQAGTAQRLRAINTNLRQYFVHI